MSDTLLVAYGDDRCMLALVDSVLIVSKLAAPETRLVKESLDNVAFITLIQTSSTHSILRIVLIHAKGDSELGVVSSKDLTVETNAFHSSTLSSSLAHLLLPLPSPTSRTLHLLINPSAGAGLALSLFEAIVKPLCDIAGVTVRNVVRMEDGTSLEGTLMVMGGDGTIHEVVNKLLGSGRTENQGHRKAVDLVILPLGTANALYYSLFPPESSATPSTSPKAHFYSFLAFLLNKSTSLHPLGLARNSIVLQDDPTNPPQSTITTVVTSVALHAAILHHSEALRATVPGIDRFKIAAHQNGNKRWNGILTLTRSVSLYNPTTRKFVEDEGKRLEGPFAYIASTLVSRFESKFIIAPLRSPLSSLHPSPSSPSLDLIVIRPRPSLDTSSNPNEFTPEVWRAMGGAYDQGSHIHLDRADGTGSLVEYYRVGGFEWAPGGEGGQEDFVCLDGVVERIGKGEKLVTEAVRGEGGVSVWY